MTSQTFSGIAQVFSLHGLSSFAHSVATANQHPTASTGTSSGSSSGSSGQLLSIYGAVEIGAQAAQQNVALLIYLLVAINLFVGFINLFPMLPLDGGHVVVAIYERIRSRRGHLYHADVTKLTPVIALFVAFILVMGIAALYSNIVQPVTLPGH
jgi:membrane-associated protease RseP (regulator of RpoE activity)